MSLREAAEAILKSVEGEMSSAYNRAHAVCCGRGIYECCGSPEPEWDEADQLVMNTLAPIQNALRAALAEAEAPKAEPVAWQQRAYSQEDGAWGVWHHIDNGSLAIRRRYPDSRVELRPLYTHPPKAEPVTLPRVYGVGRDAEYPRALVVYFDRVPTDDELRALHELVRSPPPPQMVELSDAEIIAIRDEHLPAQGEPFDFIAFARTVMAQGRKG